MRFHKIVLLLVFVICVTVLNGCTNNDSQIEGVAVKDEFSVNRVNNENKIEILGLTNEIRKVTATQLRQITKNMTYQEVIKELGNSKDIGSGRYIFRYEYENGKFFDLNFGGYDGKISEHSYEEIQNILNGESG
ncbi:hypothetical protein KZ483_12085 [Paenibacillus sp. sptzw28]|uniref:hypothetical protein n=1 Tax=Paenibacillus sp. sptzw28 TaxID=715179 RepID=UPI001C6EC086|nr:hypothetical protein [Paenibacillus sp. sptzw28]QYR23566.1 hypothetical protein KZ483_12085 [Paenibacillus sp. sptzw28]